MPIKGARGLVPLAFYLAVTVVRCFAMMSDEELTKIVESLTESVKSIQDQLMTLTCGATYSGRDLQSGSGLQNSSTNLDTGLNPVPTRRRDLRTKRATQRRK